MEDAPARGQRKELIDDIESNGVNNRLPQSIPVQIYPITGNRRAIATGNGVVEELYRPAEKTGDIRVRKQLGKITRAHLQSWDTDVNCFGLSEAIASIVEEEEGPILELLKHWAALAKTREIDGTTHTEAEIVLMVNRTWQSCQTVEVYIGVETFSARELVGFAVKFVATRLDRKVDHTSRRIAELS